MQSFSFLIFLLLSCALSLLSYASAVNLGRRHLYDDDTASLPPPLSPISPPFFPTYPSSYTPPSPPLPPPPNTYSAFHTFPANISALVLPRSPKSHSASTKLLLPALSAVLVVATTLGIAIFLYGRWRGQNRHFKDTNSTSSSSTSDEEEVRLNNNFSVAASTSTSNVFYLPADETRTCIVKPESPEIQPLPPLPRSFLPNYEAEHLSNEEEDEEEDEFYSPLASLAPSETSSPSHSCASSTWISPARSFSPSPHHSNGRYSNASSIQNLQSPSPERLRVRKNNKNGSSLRMFSLWNQNLGFPRISSVSTSPERAQEPYAFSSLYSSVSNSPDGLFRKFLDSPSPIWNDFGRNVKSVLFSADSISSRRDFVINIGESSSRFLTQRKETVAAAPPPPTRPPPLVPPSQPFVAQNDAKTPSFSELPLKQLQWDSVKSNSFKLSKEMIETLYIENSSNPNIKQRFLNQENQVLSPRKAKNITTLLPLLNLTTKDLCQALLDGDCDALGAELLECLSRLAPSDEEEKKLKSYSYDLVNQLGPAERFVKQLLDVPYVFKRIDALLYMVSFQSETEHIRRSFGVVQAACEELRNNRMFSILLDNILATGSYMNIRTNCSIGGSKLDTLLKLVEVKGSDGRSSLLQFIIQEIIKSKGTVKTLESIRNLSSELSNVKKSADIVYGVLKSDVLKLYKGIKNIKELLVVIEESECGDQWLKFRETVSGFLETAEGEVMNIKRQESLMVSELEEVTEQFHGDSGKEGDRLGIFMIVRDFLSILEKVCNEIGF